MTYPRERPCDSCLLHHVLPYHIVLHYKGKVGAGAGGGERVEVRDVIQELEQESTLWPSRLSLPCLW